MGKRFSFGAFLLIVLLILSLAVNAATGKIYDPMEKMLQSAADSALEQDWASALSLSRAANSRWIKYRLFAEMEVFARSRDREHFASTCAELAVMCQAMGDAHSGTWWNLL